MVSVFEIVNDAFIVNPTVLSIVKLWTLPKLYTLLFTC